MDGRKLQSAAEAEAAATGKEATERLMAGWPASVVTAIVVSQIRAAAGAVKRENSEDAQTGSAVRKKQKKEKKRQKQQQRRQRQKETKRRLCKVSDDEMDEEEEDRWHEMSCAFVEDAAMKKAVAWRGERELLRAWRSLRKCTREVERVKREAKVGEEAEEPTTEEPTKSSEESVGHRGWCEALVRSDGLEQGGAELDDELDWCEVVAAVKMMQTGINSVAKGATVIEENPLFATIQDAEMVAGPMTVGVASVGAAGEVQGGTVTEKVVKVADAEIARSDKTQTVEQIGDNRTDWRLMQFGGGSEIA